MDMMVFPTPPFEEKTVSEIILEKAPHCFYIFSQERLMNSYLF
jgi:hypothetical protein